MRRYYIVSGILLILSTINFVLAAPAIVQEKRREYTNVVHIPKDVTTVSGKRWEEDLEKLGEEFLKTGGKPVESSDPTLSSSFAPSGSDHGSTSVVQPPAVSSTANPDPLREPPSCSPMQGLRARGNCISWSDVWTAFKDANPLPESPLESPSAYHSPYDKLMVAHAPQPKPKPTPSIKIDPSADPDFDWNYWMTVDNPPLATPRPKGFGQADVDQVDHKNPPSISGYAPGPFPTEPKRVVTPPWRNHWWFKKPENEVVPGPPSSPVDHQPVDFLAAIYAAKGKAKVPGSVRDVENAVQRVLQLVERSLDPGE